MEETRLEKNLPGQSGQSRTTQWQDSQNRTTQWQDSQNRTAQGQGSQNRTVQGQKSRIPGRPHRLQMEDRGKLSVSGVADVISFDENQVVLDTDCGLLTIKGKELCVSRLTLEKGEVDIDGQADSLVYSSNETFRKSTQSLFSRFFQ